MKPNIHILFAVCSIFIWQFCGNPTATRADITNWQTAQTIPGTEGITPGPYMHLSGWNTDSHNLRYADFSGGLDLRGSNFGDDWLDFVLFTDANLTGASFLWGSTLANANLSHANLTNASFHDSNFGFSSTLTGADLTDAIVVGASFGDTTSLGFTAAQLYSTASYQSHDLSAIRLNENDLSGWNFAGQNLTNADFSYSMLYDADLTGAIVVGARFDYTTSQGFTQAQLYSTASYQNRDLSGIYMYSNDLSGWNFAGQNLTNADFSSSTLYDADLTDAIVVGARFDYTTSQGFTQAQLYSTASYQNRDLSGIRLHGNDLTGWNFAGQNLTNADFSSSTLYDADLTDAIVVGAWFEHTGFTQEQLYSTTSYQNRDLSGIHLSSNMTGWNFAGQDLTNAYFGNSTLTGANLSQANLTNAYFNLSTLYDANLTDAIVVGAWLINTTSRGFTQAQLYSTASYQNRDLSEIHFWLNDLTGWNLAGQNLTNADFYLSTLTGADLSQANLTNASFHYSTLTGADLTDAVVLGADFWTTTSRGFTQEQLYSTASYQNRDLVGIGLGKNDLTGWNFSGQNLTGAGFWSSTLTGADLSQANLANASFHYSTLTGADLTDAVVLGADFSATTSGGFTQEQLYSTTSYQNRDLVGIGLGENDLTGWNFADQNLTNAAFFTEEPCREPGCTGGFASTLTGADLSQANLTNAVFGGKSPSFPYLGEGSNLTDANLSQSNLTNARFDYCTLTGADLTGADTRGATGSQFAGALLRNSILVDGHVIGFELGAGQTLVVRDYDGNPAANPPGPPIPIHVEQQFVIDTGGMLQMIFEADAWDSTISFDLGIPVTLGGTLSLDFAQGVDLASQIGRTFDLFDWTGVTPSGAFEVVSAYRWDLSQLYTSGDVTLLAIPEPTSVMLLLLGTLSVAPRRSKAK